MIGRYQGILCMAAVQATPAFPPHEAMSPLKVKNVIFPHQTQAVYAFHDVTSLQSSL